MAFRLKSNQGKSKLENKLQPALETLPWGIDANELKPGAMKTISDDKLARFAIGQQQKSKFEKDREEREEKKRKAEEDAAKVYGDFVASFENNEDDYGKTFVRADTQGESKYCLNKQVINSARPSKKKKVSNMDMMLEELKQNEASRKEVTKPAKKRREIDDFLEEIKQRKPEPPTPDELLMCEGSFDIGDCNTTNLYVGNLAPTVTEQILNEEFSQFGPIQSVKIMWPRNQEEKRLRKHCGFVSFLNRSDADEARINLNDSMIHGQVINVCWGKAVRNGPNIPPLMPHLLISQNNVSEGKYIIDIGEDDSSNEDEINENIPKRSPHNSGSRRSRSKSRSPVRSEEDKFMTGQQLANARDKERGREKTKLGRYDYNVLLEMLDNVTSDKNQIKEIMGFALDFSECAKDISQILRDKIVNEKLTPNSAIARLYVVSDILHNSTAPVTNASLYRTQLEETLPEIIDKMNETYEKIGGRMSANVMREKVLSVLRAWKTWSLFHPVYILGLYATFIRKQTSDMDIDENEIQLSIEVLRRKCRQTGLITTGDKLEIAKRIKMLGIFAESLTEEKVDGTIDVMEIPETKMLMRQMMQDIGFKVADVQNLVDDKELEDQFPFTNQAINVKKQSMVVVKDIDSKLINDDKDLDGMSMRQDEDIDGEPMEGDEDIDGEPMEGDEDIDGAPLEEDEDIDGVPLDEENFDGEPMDDDIDGEPM